MVRCKIGAMLYCYIALSLISCGTSKHTVSDNGSSEQVKEEQHTPAVSGRKAVTVNPNKDGNTAERQDAGHGN